MTSKDAPNVLGFPARRWKMSRVGTPSRDAKQEPDRPMCYLCGLPVEGKVSQDHVPPCQFFTKSLRRMRSPNLLTLPTHEACNRSYQADEDYFFVALGGLNEDARIHDWLIQDIGKKIRRDKAVGLRNAVLAEFSQSISGICLPSGLIAKHFDQKRVHRVVWKIVRGLYYHHFSRVIPENARHCVEIRQIQDKPPDLYKAHLAHAPPHGAYPEVFVYQFVRVSERDCLSGLWALFFWESIVAIVPVIPSEPGKIEGTEQERDATIPN